MADQRPMGADPVSTSSTPTNSMAAPPGATGSKAPNDQMPGHPSFRRYGNVWEVEG